MFDDLSDERLQAGIAEERARFFRSGWWVGPIGVIAAVCLHVAIIENAGQAPDLLRWWAVFMFGCAGLQVATFAFPPLARRTNRHGLPKVANWAYGLVGAGFGSVMWLDLEATASVEFRWVTVATLFAVTAGIIGGVTGISWMGVCTLVPMYLVAAPALIVAGQPVPAVALVTFVAIVLRDIKINSALWTELIALRVHANRVADENEWAANHDDLTGLFNRSGMMQRLTQQANETVRPVRVMFIDLDHFKEVNDRFGHEGGDRVLVETAQRLRRSLRASDDVGRLGGDEFCVLLGPDHDDAASVRLANRIIDVLEQPMQGAGDEDAYISASIGIAALDPAEATAQRLLRDADHAMYEAKRTGRRQVVRFNEALRSQFEERSGLETSLRRAIRDGSIRADAQPAFSVETGEIRAVELLARWQLPSGSMVPPSTFIPLAEDIGLIGDLTRRMLGIAGETLASWSSDPQLSDTKIAVNVSSIEFSRGRLVESVADAIERFEIRPGQLLLEVTESHELNGDAKDLEQFEALRSLGVRVAIDDFGTGYSSLDQLLRLPIDAVKLDRSLIAQIGNDPRHAAVIRRIHDLASVVGQLVVVEGVETTEQLELLKSIGATYAQGYLLCRPVPVQDLATHIADLDRVRPAAASFDR